MKKNLSTGKTKRLTVRQLVAKGVPAVLIPGFIVAAALGWKYGPFKDQTNYYHIKQVFPDTGVVVSVEDGDTFVVHNGVKVRLLAIDAVNRGEEGFIDAKEMLTQLVLDKKVFLEYDRYQNDKYGRVLAWAWVGCEQTPTFLPPKYMHESGNRSKPGLKDNPQGCSAGSLVNEALIASGAATVVTYEGRGPLKYQERIEHLVSNSK